jgi:predicted ATPase
MISRIRFINFRSHSDSTLVLRPLSLLIGPVAAGKSNVFKGLLLVQNSVHRSLVELFPPGLGEFHLVRSRWADETAPIGFEVTVDQLPDFPGQVARYTLKLAEAPEGIYVLEETLQREIGVGPAQWVFQRRSRSQSLGEFGSVSPYDPTIMNRVWHSDPRVRKAAPGPIFARAVAQSISRFGYYHLEAAELKSLGTGEPSSRIGYNGERLPDFIAWAKEADDVYPTILKQMQEILPGLEDILVTRTQLDRQGIAMAFQGYRGYIAAPDLSDGTLFTLGLLCIGAAQPRPELMCIEEPEAGLHPRRLRWLFERFVELAYPKEGQGATQIVLSTHSPYLVDMFSDMTDAVQIVEQIDGRTKIISLEEIETAKLHRGSHSGKPIGRNWARGLYEGL